MLIDQNIHPNKNIYSIWADIIQLLIKEKKKWNSISFDILYSLFLDIHKEKNIGIEYFTYVLDWLFLLWLIQHNENKTKLTICF